MSPTATPYRHVAKLTTVECYYFQADNWQCAGPSLALYCMYTQIVSQSAGNGTTGTEIKVFSATMQLGAISGRPDITVAVTMLPPRSSQDEPHCRMHPNCWLHCSLSLSDRQELAAWTFTQQHSIYYSASQTGSRLCVWDAFSCHLAGLHLNFYSLASPRTLNTLHAWSNCHFSTSLYY